MKNTDQQSDSDMMMKCWLNYFFNFYLQIFKFPFLAQASFLMNNKCN